MPDSIRLRGTFLSLKVRLTIFFIPFVISSLIASHQSLAVLKTPKRASEGPSIKHQVVQNGNEICKLPVRPEEQKLEDVSRRFVVRSFLVNKDGSRKQLCSGTLISSREILTAAHCFNDAKDSDFVQKKNGKKIQVEIYDSSKNSTRLVDVDGIRTRLEPGFIDVAVLRLNGDVESDRAFPKLSNGPCDGDIFAGGFGILNDHDNKASCPNIAQFGPERVLHQGELARSKFVTQPDSKSVGRICGGDSGGPVFCVDKNKDPVILGVVKGIGPSKENEKDFEKTVALLKEGKITNGEACLAADHMKFTRVQDSISLIRRFQRELLNSKPASTGNVESNSSSQLDNPR